MKHTKNYNPSPTQRSYATVYRPISNRNDFAHCCINYGDILNYSISGTMLIAELKRRCKNLGINTIIDISHSSKIIGLNKANALKHNCKII